MHRLDFSFEAKDHDSKVYFEDGLYDLLGALGVKEDSAENIIRVTYHSMVRDDLHFHREFLPHIKINLLEYLNHPINNILLMVVWFSDVIFYPNFSQNKLASAKFMECLLAPTDINKDTLKDAVGYIKSLEAEHPQLILLRDLEFFYFILEKDSYHEAIDKLQLEYGKENFINHIKNKIVKDRHIFQHPSFLAFNQIARDRIRSLIE